MVHILKIPSYESHNYVKHKYNHTRIILKEIYVNNFIIFFYVYKKIFNLHAININSYKFEQHDVFLMFTNHVTL